MHIQCCEGSGIQNFIPVDVYYAEKKAAAGTGPPIPKATLNTISEPRTCAYKATVCTPLLCKRAVKEKSDQVLSDILRSLNNTCLMRQEDWWTYELCFAKGIRQLRINSEQSVLPDGAIEVKKVEFIAVSVGGLVVMTVLCDRWW